jgi:hypothetical protein
MKTPDPFFLITAFRITRLGVIWALFPLVLPLPLRAQRIAYDPETKKISYSALVQVNGVDKEDLYTRSRKWATDTFLYMHRGPLVEQQEEGRLYVQAGFLYQSFLSEGKISYSCTISVEDGQYRYVFTDFAFQGFASLHYQGFNTYLPLGPPIHFEHPAVGSKTRILKETDKQIQFLISDLQHTLARQPYWSLNSRQSDVIPK